MAKPVPTTVIGPLGSTVHILRADADTVAALAVIDWNRRFRRVCVDPARGLVTLMSPSRLHEELATIFGDIVDVAAEILCGAGRGIGSTRLRGSGDPPDTGMEPDCAFYVGDHAKAYSRALRQGEAAADTFLEQTPPDLVVEVEITNADEGQGGALRGRGCAGDVAVGTDARAHAHLKPNSSPCVRVSHLDLWSLPRFWKGWSLPTCGRRWTKPGSAPPRVNASRPSPGSCADDGSALRASGRRRRPTLPNRAGPRRTCSSSPADPRSLPCARHVSVRVLRYSGLARSRRLIGFDRHGGDAKQSRGPRLERDNFCRSVGRRRRRDNSGGDLSATSRLRRIPAGSHHPS